MFNILTLIRGWLLGGRRRLVEQYSVAYFDFHGVRFSRDSDALCCRVALAAVPRALCDAVNPDRACPAIFLHDAIHGEYGRGVALGGRIAGVGIIELGTLLGGKEQAAEIGGVGGGDAGKEGEAQK